jgi:hypothetical protein
VSAYRINVQRILLAAAIAVMPAIAVAQAKSDVPIMLGGNSDEDACASAGVVAGLNRRGDGFLSVRNGPGGHYAETDRVYNGRQVHICANKGTWMAVIYGGDGRDCGVSSPWPKQLAYTGPCKYGWVSSRFISVTAG